MSIAQIVAAKAAQAVAGSLIKAGVSTFRGLRENNFDFHGDLKSVAADFGMSDRLEAIGKLIPSEKSDASEKLSAESRETFLRARERLMSFGFRQKTQSDAANPMPAESASQLARLYRRADELIGRAADVQGVDRRALIQGAVDTAHELKERATDLGKKGFDTKPFMHASQFLDESLNGIIARSSEPRLTLTELHAQSAGFDVEHEVNAQRTSQNRNKV